MYWKKYRTMPAKEKRDEIYYIIGLDIGNDSTGIAFYNVADNQPEIIDLSGGYGRPTIPTAMQYVVETREWVFGEYAVLNRGIGKEITLKHLVAQLGQSELIDIDNKLFKVFELLGMYIKEILSNIKNINPKAEIVGIVASTPSYFSSNAKKELVSAFKSAGYEKELIALVSDRDCVFSYYYDMQPKIEQSQLTLLLDYASSEVRGGIYQSAEKPNNANKELTIKSISSLFEPKIGTFQIEEQIKTLFTGYYTANNPLQSKQELERIINEQLAAFTYQHKDILFQKAIRNKPVKLYFNFAFPPFQQTISKTESDALIEPFRKRFNKFIANVMEKSMVNGKKITPANIDKVICTGGGFEMLWVKEAIDSLFPHDKLQVYRNPKAITAMGAAVIAANRLNLPRETACSGVIIEDKHQLSADIGVILKGNNFVALAECNNFWWQVHPLRFFIVNDEITGDYPLTILARSPDGDVRILLDTKLTNLPKRPKGTTRLSLQMKFISDSEGIAMVADEGFGEFFPRTDYLQEIKIKL
ncbi:MAG: DUF5716 family protein [Firmicutes bacterium]|nr:DUF5716 family protein [Bacillota bacterium]